VFDARGRTWLTSFLLMVGVMLTAVPVVHSAEPSPRLVIATSTPYDTLDPHLLLETERSDVRLALYDSLFRWLDGPIRIAPWLAQSYTVSEDGRTFRFMLRKDVVFHDGRELRAADVVYSVERILALKRGVAPLLAGLVSPGSTKVIDSHTVEFSLGRASPLFLTLLPEMTIVNAELLKANEVNNDWGRAWLQGNSAGSGAYRLKTRTPGGGLIAERVAGHWNGGGPAKPIDEIELRPMLDPERRVKALIDGEAHVLDGNLLPHQIQSLRASKDIAVVDSDGPRAFTGLMHAGRDPFKTGPMRRIFAQAFDVDLFMASTLANGASALPVPLPPALGGPPPGFSGTRFDLAAAADAMVKLKVPVRELTIGAIAGDPHSERAALVMLDGLGRLAIPARIVVEPWPVVASRMRDDKQMYDILFLWRGTRYLDANNWLGEMFDCDLLGQGNASWYCNKDVDRLIKEARGMADARLRRAAFEKAATLLAEDQAAIFVATSKRTIAHSKRIKGLRLTPVGESIDPRAATFE
jgi:peptide/nickel transport system substrate-binding protein